MIFVEKHRPFVLILALAALTSIGLLVPAVAQMRPSMNLNGVAGLIDMPSGEAQPDGFLSIDHGQFGQIGRTTLTFQITPRLSGSFRYVGIKHWNDRFCPPDCSGGNGFSTYYDRNFDLKFRLLDEGKYLPSVSIGLQDFIGTGLSMAEYIAATKSFGPKLKVTAGLGFGRLGSYNPIGQIFGDRPKVSFGNGGKPNYDQWFRGDVALFGGIEYQLTNKLTLKAEYSSDDYTTEAQRRGTFDKKSPLNYGIEYQLNPMLRMGLYSMYGSEIGFNLSFVLNPAQRPSGGIGGQGPEPVKPRPVRSQNPDAWTATWLDQADVRDVLIDNLGRNLVRTGISVESLSISADRAQVRFRNTKYDAVAQAAGRIARAMTQTMPASVEVFELVPVVNGMATSMITIRRSDIETLEFAADPGTTLRGRTAIASARAPAPDKAANGDLYPKFNWSITPTAQTMLFDPRAPFQINVNANLRASYEIAPGVILSGSVTKRVWGNILGARPNGASPLPPVRSNAAAYFKNADPAIETLTAAWYGKLAPELYGRVTVGYLETMFAGVSSELLWKPANSRFALGVEADYVAQRSINGGLDLAKSNYRVATGMVSGYLDLGRDFDLQLDVGRYLAGDVGGTITLMRRFSNGWRVGAFATITNVSAKDFGEGSFDKGIKMDIPLSWFVGQPTRTQRTFVLRPLGRDGGSQLQVNDRLAYVLRGYDERGLDAQWGRFWK